MSEAIYALLPRPEGVPIFLKDRKIRLSMSLAKTPSVTPHLKDNSMLIPKNISNIPWFSTYFEKNKEFEPKKYKKFRNYTQHHQKCAHMLGCTVGFEYFEFENSDLYIVKIHQGIAVRLLAHFYIPEPKILSLPKG